MERFKYVPAGDEVNSRGQSPRNHTVNFVMTLKGSKECSTLSGSAVLGWMGFPGASRNARPRLLTLSPRGTTAIAQVMIDYVEKDGRLIFNVRVVPRASRSEIVGEHDGALRVRLAAPPVDGAANDELLRILARALKVSRTSVAIIAGPTSKLKRVAVNGVAPEVLLALVGVK
jgi:uncharacterized protein (TIGR00251 family)